MRDSFRGPWTFPLVVDGMINEFNFGKITVMKRSAIRVLLGFSSIDSIGDSTRDRSASRSNDIQWRMLACVKRSQDAEIAGHRRKSRGQASSLVANRCRLPFSQSTACLAARPGQISLAESRRGRRWTVARYRRSIDAHDVQTCSDILSQFTRPMLFNLP